MSIPDLVTTSTKWLTYLVSWISGDESTVAQDPNGVDRDSPRKQIADLIAGVEADATAGLAGLSVGAHGPTDDRPNLGSGVRFIYFDDDLSKLIVWNGSSWTNADGTTL